MKHAILKVCSLIILAASLSACTGYDRVDEQAFIGTWQLKGRKIYDGMQISITKDADKFKGYITIIPTGKYTKMFLDSGATWISGIDRTSNFAFKLKEQKLAGELFSMYGLESSTAFYAAFSESRDRINLYSSSPTKPGQSSDIYYERVK